MLDCNGTMMANGPINDSDLAKPDLSQAAFHNNNQQQMVLQQQLVTTPGGQVLA
jgi:hypothetical protein